MSVLRPRFSILTPNRKWADGYKRVQRFKYPAVTQQIQVHSWHLEGLVLDNGDKVKGSRRKGILSTKTSITVTVLNQKFSD